MAPSSGSNKSNHSGDVVCKNGDVTVIDCLECGFKHILPIPSDQQLEDFYTQDFYEKLWPEAIAGTVSEQAWNEIGFVEKFQKFEELLPDPGSRRLLDIGSGSGHFLKCGQDRHWEVLGLEPAASAHEFCTTELGVPAQNCSFTSNNHDQFGEFDVVTLNKVFEHLPDPRETLALVQTILKPDGLVCLTVPNDFSPLQEIAAEHLQKDPWWVDPTEHINYFDSVSLQNLLLRCGFATEHLTTSFPLELFLLMGEDYISDPEVGKAIHNKRKQFEMIMEKSGHASLKKQLYASLQSLGLGRELIIYGRKPGKTSK